MKNKAFGLDIGTTSIKALWLSHEQQGYLLNATAVVPTPSTGMLSDSPIDQEQMSQTIIKLVTDAKITTKYVNIALPETQVYTKVVDMPILSDKELSSAIFYEAEQFIPVPLESLSFDYKVLKKNQNDMKMQVLLVGAPIAIVEKYEKILMGAGLSIASVETEVLAVLRALVIGDNFPPTLIVNIGSLTSSLAIVKDGNLVFTYAVPIGGAAITRAIATEFNFSMAQAEEYKKTYGISSRNLEGKIGKAAEPILTSIMAEVKKAMAFYSEKFKEEGPITQVLLSGGGARLQGLNIYFAQNCGIETAISNPWKILTNQQVPKEILDDAPDYALAVGLAMRE